ncbi:MAG: hypothetical protein PHQ64_02510 [Bacilli bacterium]|nr:hypothetical protein [Bacilli bacterium]
MANVKGKKVVKEENSNVKGLVWSYFKLLCLFSLTIFITVFIRNSYHSYVANELNTPVLENILIHKITTSEELFGYLNENQKSVVYIGVASDLDCRKLENRMIKVIEEKKLQDDIIYVNLNDLDEISRINFMNKINSKYDEIVGTYPTIIYFENGKIEDVAKTTTEKKLTIGMIVDFLEDNDINSIN